MSLPFTTNVVDVEEADDSGDKWESGGRSYTTTYTAVPCVIAFKDSESNTTALGEQQTVEFTLYTNSDINITRGARVTDTVNGDVYLTTWTQLRRGLGLDRRETGLRLVEGVN